MVIALAAVCWIGYTLLPPAERHRVLDPLRDFVPQPKPAHADEDFVTFFKRFLSEHTPSVSMIVSQPERRVIAISKIEGGRCHVLGEANGVPMTFTIDTGDPIDADFSSSHITKLGINPAALHYEEIWPNTRYGKIATTTLREIRTGYVRWSDAQVRIYSNWRYSFGDDETPLFGLMALQRHDIHVEFDGGMCRLTAPSE
jgi:predicted aspartyl protease